MEQYLTTHHRQHDLKVLPPNRRRLPITVGRRTVPRYYAIPAGLSAVPCMSLPTVHNPPQRTLAHSLCHQAIRYLIPL